MNPPASAAHPAAPPAAPPPGASPRIPDATVQRLSLYLRHLEELSRAAVTDIASRDMARRAATTAAQVRKDLSHLGSLGKRGFGYDVEALAGVLRRVLGLDSARRVALLGAGRIGTALFEYQPFRTRGFHITTVVDSDPRKVGARLGDVTICGEDDLEAALRRDRTDLVIVAVPANAAQSLLDRVVAAGIKAVLNYAPVQLRAPDDVSVRNVNMLVELECLSHALARDAERPRRAPPPPGPGTPHR